MRSDYTHYAAVISLLIIIVQCALLSCCAQQWTFYFSQIEVGDVIRVNGGDFVPADAVILASRYRSPPSCQPAGNLSLLSLQKWLLDDKRSHFCPSGKKKKIENENLTFCSVMQNLESPGKACDAMNRHVTPIISLGGTSVIWFWIRIDKSCRHKPAYLLHLFKNHLVHLWIRFL